MVFTVNIHTTDIVELLPFAAIVKRRRKFGFRENHMTFGANILPVTDGRRGSARILPRASLKVIPKAGHSVYFEQPKVFNSLLIDFIEGTRK